MGPVPLASWANDGRGDTRKRSGSVDAGMEVDEMTVSFDGLTTFRGRLEGGSRGSLLSSQTVTSLSVSSITCTKQLRDKTANYLPG